MRSSKKNEFWDFFSVFVKVFCQFWIRFCSDEKMIADIDILFKIAGLHDRMIAGLHDRKIICGKVHIFLFFEHIALRVTLPCRCNLVLIHVGCIDMTPCSFTFRVFRIFLNKL